MESPHAFIHYCIVKWWHFFESSVNAVAGILGNCAVAGHDTGATGQEPNS